MTPCEIFPECNMKAWINFRQQSFMCHRPFSVRLLHFSTLLLKMGDFSEKCFQRLFCRTKSFIIFCSMEVLSIFVKFRVTHEIFTMFLIIKFGQSPPFYIYYVTVWLCFHKYPPLRNDTAFPPSTLNDKYGQTIKSARNNSGQFH